VHGIKYFFRAKSENQNHFSEQTPNFGFEPCQLLDPIKKSHRQPQPIGNKAMIFKIWLNADAAGVKILNFDCTSVTADTFKHGWGIGRIGEKSRSFVGQNWYKVLHIYAIISDRQLEAISMFLGPQSSIGLLSWLNEAMREIGWGHGHVLWLDGAG
jgi:hypothetical protein